MDTENSEQGWYSITQTDCNKRFFIRLYDEKGSLLLESEGRELKPMCMNEISWIRNVGSVDSLYEMVNEDGSWHFVLHARDAHILGRSPKFATREACEVCRQALARVCKDAALKDSTPDEDFSQRIPDLIRDYTREVLEAGSEEALAEKKAAEASA